MTLCAVSIAFLQMQNEAGWFGKWVHLRDMRDAQMLQFWNRVHSLPTPYRRHHAIPNWSVSVAVCSAIKRRYGFLRGARDESSCILSGRVGPVRCSCRLSGRIDACFRLSSIFVGVGVCVCVCVCASMLENVHVQAWQHYM